MENKNTLGGSYPGGINYATPNNPSNAGGNQVSSFSGAPPPPPPTPDRGPKKLRIIILTALALLIVGGIVWLVVLANQKNQNTAQFNNSEIGLDGIASAADSLLEDEELTVLGQLNIDGGFAIQPTSRPSTAKAGQIYYDQATNLLSYYNGTEFIELSGQDLTVSTGLTSSGGILTNSGVLSLQGQTGDVTLVAGDGITITGTTISSTTSGDGTVGSPGGTSGKLAKFTGAQTIADSLLTESGTTISVAGDLAVTGGLSLATALSVANGGTGSTSLTSNGVLVGNGTGAVSSVTAAGAGLCLQSTAGAPAFAACPGGSGTFLQDGNSFGATATLGTNDANDLVLERNNAAKLTVGANSLTLASGIDLLLQGSGAFISNSQGFVDSESFGNGAVLGADGAIAVGAASSAGFIGSIAFGAGATTTTTNQLVIGGSSHYISQVVIGNGVTNASPQNTKIQGTSGSGANIAGADLTLAGGQSTGNAFGGSLVFQISPLGTPGSSLNGLTTVGSIGGAAGAVNFINATNSTQAFNIENSAGGNLFTVDTANSRVGVNLTGNNTPSLADTGLEVNGALRLSGTVLDTFTTPLGAGISARLNIASLQLSGASQALAIGLTDTSNTTARGITVLDARAGTHQPSIAVISPDENNIGGFTWDGSNSNFRVSNSNAAGTLSLGITTSDILTIDSAGADVAGILAVTSLGAADTTTALCRNSSNQIATCSSTGSGVAFVNGGNSFGGTATLGTNDVNGLSFEVNNVAVTTYATDGSATFQNSTNSTTAFRVLDSAGTSTVLDVDTTNSRVGIGIAAPTSRLHVYEGTTGGASLALFRDNPNGSAVEILSTGTDSPLIRGGANDSLSFAVNNGTVPSLRITSTGDIYIGTSDVTGSLLVLDTKTGSGDPTGVNGGMYYNSNTGKLRCYQAGAWENCIGTDAGEIKMYAGSSAPAGWLMCDGTAVSRTTYASLFAVISTTYGAGDGSTTFNLPNCKGRQIVGRDAAQTEFDVLGETGGEKTHTQTTAEMPSHTHSVSGTAASAGAHTHNVGRDFDGAAGGSVYSVHDTGSSGAQGQSPTSSAGAHTHTVSGTAAATGSGTAFNVLDPYLVVNYIIKY